MYSIIVVHYYVDTLLHHARLSLFLNL
jgi:hypothetical protein